MSHIKDFLDRRAAGLAKDSQHDTEEDHDLSDKEFWKIMEQFKSLTADTDNDPVSILEDILEGYSTEKIIQFADRYKKLNS